MNVITTANCGNGNGCLTVDWGNNVVVVSVFDSEGFPSEFYSADTADPEMLMEAHRMMSVYVTRLGLPCYAHRGKTVDGTVLVMFSLSPRVGFREVDLSSVSSEYGAERQCWVELFPPESSDLDGDSIVG